MIESEESVVGSLMVAPVVDKVLSTGLTSKDFSNEHLGYVYDTILAMHHDDEKIDIITVKNHTKGKGINFDYLAMIADNTPSVNNVAVYANHIRSKSLKEQIEARKKSITFENSEEVKREVSLLQEELENKDETSMNSIVGKTVDYMEDVSKNGTGIASGFYALDGLINGFRPGSLTVLAGRPSMGKSTLALNITSNIADDKNVLFFSLEMSQVQLAMKMACSATKTHMTKLDRQSLSEKEYETYMKGLSAIGDKKLNIVDKGGLTVQDIISKCRAAKNSKGLDFVVIDYLQLMKYDKGREISELGTITRELKSLSKELEIPIILLSQLSRAVEQRENKHPLMSDLRASGEIEQDADVILFVYRDEYYNKESMDNKGIANLIVAKNRMGMTSWVDVKFEGEYSRFSDL